MEAAFKQFLARNGTLSAMMNCVGHNDIHSDFRKATGLVLKYHIRDHFMEEKDDSLPSSFAFEDDPNKFIFVKFMTYFNKCSNKSLANVV
jgi:hypothetical protein